MKPVNPFRLGYNRKTGEPVILYPEDLRAHLGAFASTGRGKSKTFEGFARHCLENRLPGILFDPHGDSYRAVLRYATANHHTSRLVTVDPNEAGTHVFPLNVLAPNGSDPAVHAERIIAAIAKIFGQQDESKPRLERFLRAALLSLLAAKLTMAELLDFVSLSDTSFRHAVLEQLPESADYVRQEWANFDSIKSSSERATLLEAVLNRVARIVGNDCTRRVLGAPTFGLDWATIRRERKFVLVNLQPSNRTSVECTRLLGTLILDNLTTYALGLPEGENHTPFFILADELDELVSADFALALQAFRKRNVFVWCALQYLEQLRAKDDTSKLYASVMANTDVKLVFHVSAEDAERLCPEIFSGEVHGDHVKDEIHHSVFAPKESERTIYGKSNSESELESDGTSQSTASGFGAGFLHSESIADSETMNPNLQMLNTAHIAGSTSASSRSESGSSGSSTSRSTARGRSTTESEVTVPFYEFEREQELSSRSYYSPEEIREGLIADIQLQPQRHCFAKIGDSPAVPIVTAYIAPVRVREKDTRKTLERLRQRYTLPAEQVDRMIAERRTAHLLQNGEDEVDDRENWMPN